MDQKLKEFAFHAPLLTSFAAIRVESALLSLPTTTSSTDPSVCLPAFLPPSTRCFLFCFLPFRSSCNSCLSSLQAHNGDLQRCPEQSVHLVQPPKAVEWQPRERADGQRARVEGHDFGATLGRHPWREPTWPTPGTPLHWSIPVITAACNKPFVPPLA